VLTLTTGDALNQNRAAWQSAKVDYTDAFDATFVYKGGNSANGETFVLQNSAAGTNALGGIGGSLGYTAGGQNGAVANDHSIALGWNVGGTSTIQGGQADPTATVTNALWNAAVGTGTVALNSGDPILFNITGSGSSNQLSYTLTDETNSHTFSGAVTLTNTLSNILGGTTAYVGFTASTSGGSQLQTISNFSYTNAYSGNFSLGNTLVVAANSTVDAAYTGGTVSVGNLNIGSQTLNVINSVGGNASFATSQVNLSGSPTIAPAAGVKVSLGSLNDGGTASVMTIAGNGSTGVVSLTTGASSFDSSSIHVNSGTLLVDSGGSSATGAGSVVVASGALIGGNGTVNGPVAVNSGATLFVGDTNNTLNKSAGSLTIGSGSSLAGSTLLDITSPTSADELTVNGSGAVTLGGSLTVTNPNSVIFTSGESFQLFGFSSETGTFSSISEPALGTGLSWNNSALYSSGLISISAVASGPSMLTWNNASTNGTWDTSSANFNNGSANVAYSDSSNTSTGDIVTFNDANGGNYTVSISGVVHPTSVTFNNSAGNYTVSGATGTSGIAGNTSLTLQGTGTVTLSSNNSYTGGTFVNAGTLVLVGSTAFPTASGLTVSSGATVQIASHSTGNASTPVVSVLSNAGTIDLTNNALDVQNGNLGTISAQVAAAFHNGTWTGTGGSGTITSSTAAGDTRHLTAVGVATNLSSFEGQSVAATDVLVKYTYYGDANLDGQVSSADYTLIDNGFLSHATGWQNGDFNYDSTINGSDYTLIDNAFNTQGAQLSSEIANPSAGIAAQIAGTSSAVPEPTTLGLLGLGALGLLGRRRRRSN
jgi:autotransporter-associated beta strand protein